MLFFPMGKPISFLSSRDILEMSSLQNFEVLYDIKHDPHETNNLVNNLRYKMKLEELRGRYKN